VPQGAACRKLLPPSIFILKRRQSLENEAALNNLREGSLTLIKHSHSPVKSNNSSRAKRHLDSLLGHRSAARPIIARFGAYQVFVSKLLNLGGRSCTTKRPNPILDANATDFLVEKRVLSHSFVDVRLTFR
jgi:hypothetical protein